MIFADPAPFLQKKSGLISKEISPLFSIASLSFGKRFERGGQGFDH